MATQNKEFLNAFKEVGKEKGISPEILFDAIESALIAAYKKNFNSQAQNVRVFLDRNTGEFHVYAIKNVVDVVENDVLEESLQNARKINPHCVVGDTIEEEITPASFGRLATQTAKQVVVQRIKEAERNMVYDEYINRVGDILTGIVQRVENKNIIIDLGKTEAILTPAEQIPTEKYFANQRLKLYIVDVKKTSKGPQIILSRTHPNLLKRLFELEVSEISEGVVEIKSVAREPGMRSKIAVYATDSNIDPVGSCVGPKGVRVQTIVNELNGEKIDIVKWNADPKVYIANALSPAQVTSVAIQEDEKMSRVVVPDYHLSLAIGKEGQNARLAAKLTGWKIDIKSETQAAETDDSDMQFVKVTGEEAFSIE